MKFKYSKMIPADVRNTLDNVSDYALYSKLSDYSHKGRVSSTDVLNMYRMWHFFDGSVTGSSVPGMFNRRLSGLYSFSDRYDNDYYFGLPSLPDLVMYIVVLLMKQDVIPNAKKELELFRRGIKIISDHGPLDPDADNLVDFLDSQLSKQDLSMFHSILDKMHFITSGTQNELGLQKLQALVDGYTLLIDIRSYASLKIEHTYGEDLVKVMPAFINRSPNSDILNNLCEETKVDHTSRFSRLRPNKDKNEGFYLPDFISRYVVFKKKKDIDLLVTAEELRRDYGDLLRDTPGFRKSYYMIGNIDEMRKIHDTIKNKIPSNVTCRTFADIYSSEKSKGNNFKVKMQLPKTVLKDDPERLRTILDKLYDLDPSFLMSDNYQGLDKNQISASRNLSTLTRIIAPAMLKKAIAEEFDSTDIARGEVIDPLRQQLDIMENFAPTKFGTVYKKLDDNIFEVIAEVFYRKNLTISFHIDSLHSINRLKLHGLNVMSIEYSYYLWKDVLEYLENR